MCVSAPCAHHTHTLSIFTSFRELSPYNFLHFLADIKQCHVFLLLFFLGFCQPVFGSGRIHTNFTLFPFHTDFIVASDFDGGGGCKHIHLISHLLCVCCSLLLLLIFFWLFIPELVENKHR